MKAISKKLLSLLVVIAMVLSMVPFGGLSIFAVETKAAAEDEIATVGDEIEYGSANLTTEQAAEVQRGQDVQTAANAIEIPEEGNTFEAECPVCKTTVTWTKSTGAIGTKAEADTSYHYYWTGTIAGTGYNWISTNGGSNTKVCLLMRDAVSDGGNTFMVAGTDSEINIMGTGTITSDGSTSQGYGLFKVGGTRAKLNLYGGTFIYTGNNLKNDVVTYGALNLNAAASTANIYADAVIGKATEDTAAANYNVLVASGTLNMYGGTIQNGISGDTNYSGNVTVNGDNASFNMYGGSISGGSRAASATSATTAGHAVRIHNSGIFNMYGGTITGGKSWNGGQGGAVYTQAKWTSDESYIEKAVLNLQGGTITGGQSNGHGGNVSGYRGVVNIGGTVLIKDGVPKSTSNSGANIYIPNAPLVVNITGGKIEGGNGKTGGSIFNNATTNAYAQLNISGGIITGGKATDGGNIYVAAGAPISITGGTIQNGTATGNGGNIYFADSATISGGTIQNGTAATNGGNIYLTAATLTITDGTIIGGESQNSHGGNITATNGAHLTVSGGVIANGNCGVWQGGNIHVWNSRLDISGGYIYGGTNTSGTSANENIWAQGNATGGTMDTPMPVVNISGGHINGDCRVSGTITLSGNPVITRELTVPDENGGTKVVTAKDGGFTITYPTTEGYNPTTVKVDGLTAGENGAKIEIWNAESALAAITVASENAQELIDGGNIVADRSGYRAVCKDNIVYVEVYEEEPEVGVFDPESFDGMAYCPVCLANGTHTEPVEWTALTSSDSATATAYAIKNQHVYLAGDLTDARNVTINLYSSGTDALTGCFNLNGHTLSMAGRVSVTSADETLNIMDTSSEKDGVLESTGANKANDKLYAHTLAAMNGGKIVLHGGTFKNTESVASGVAYLNGSGSSLTVKEGVKLDASGAKYGVIQNSSGTSLVMTGGEITGNVEIKGSLTLSGAPTIGKETTGLVLADGVLADVSGLAEGASIVVTEAEGTVISSACNSPEDAARIAGYFTVDGEGLKVAANSSDQLYVATAVETPVPGDFRPWACDGKAYCPICGTLETWKVFNSYAYTGVQGHFYLNDHLTKDASQPVTVSSGTGCFNLNGYTLSMNGRVGLTAANTTLNIMDTAGGGVITTTGTRTENDLFNHTFSVQSTNTTLNLYGGTFKNTNANGGDYAVVRVNGDGNKVNIYEGAVIDGCGKSRGVKVEKGTLVLDGGTIQNGYTTQNGGNIYVAAAGELEIKDGEVHHGTAAVESSDYAGGNIWSAGKVTMSGGKVHTGTAKLGPGGNVVIANADMEMSGDAKIYDGTAEAHQGGNVRVYKGKLTMSDNAKIYGGHSGSPSKSHNVWIVAGDMEMSGDSYVYGKEQTNGNAIALGPTGGINCTLTLKGNAKVMNDPTDPVVSKGSINLGYTANNDTDLTNDLHANIVIDDSWTGEAYIMMFKSTNALNDAGTATKMAWLNIGDTVDGGVGSVNGPVGTGTSFTGNLYYTARTYYTGIIGSDSGKLVLAGHAVVDTTNDTEQWMSMEDAVAAANGNKTKYLKAVDDVTLSDETVYIDALKDIEVTVSGTGTAYGIDIANGEDYNNASTGKFSGNVQSDATFNEVRYIKIADGSVHAIEMGITGVSLRPTAVGLYYKATYKCDADLAKAIDAYGVVLSVNDMPGADFADKNDNQFTIIENIMDHYDTVKHQISANSGSVFNIMDDDAINATPNNQTRGEMKIYANAYILVEGNANPIVADTKNADKKVTDDGFTGVALSLYDVLKKVDEDEQWAKLSPTNIDQVNALFDKIKAWGVNWSFDNIKDTNA